MASTVAGGYALRRARRGLRWLSGGRGEQKVGGELDALRGDGWRIVHDIDTGRGNIDHVAIGPAGVFLIETKTWGAGRFRADRVNPRWLKRAYAQSKALEEITGRSVEPVIAVVRAWMDKPVVRRRGVLVLSDRMLARQLRGRASVLDAREVERLHERVATAFERR